MSWTTSPPFSSRPVSRQPTEPSAATTPLSLSSTKPAPRSLALLGGDSNSSRPRTPVSPHKLAKLANALGVATPAPVSVPYSLYSPTTSNTGSSFGGSTSTPSRYLVHVIPPHHLLLAMQDDSDDPHDQAQFRRGTLVPLHPTLNSQLGAIAREYSLPSIGGVILYLLTDNEPGPRITDDAWRMLWYRALQIDKDGTSNGKSIARHHSRTTTSTTLNSPYPSPSTTSESPYRSGSPMTDNASLSSFDLPFNLNPSSALPILAKVEFDIDKRKAPWYERWRHRRRTTSHSIAASPHLLGSFPGSGSTRVLQLPLRARSTSPSLADFKAKYAPTSPSASSAQVNLNSSEGSSSDVAQEGYMQLDDEVQPKRRMFHNGELTEDPLGDVFPSDKATWEQMRSEPGAAVEGSAASPATPEIMIGGKIGSNILSMNQESEEEGMEEENDAEDVLALWKEKHKPTLDSLSTPGSPSSHQPRSRSASKHIPPPLDLTASSKSQIPHVEIAPPTATATSPNMSVNSDLPYLDSEKAIASSNRGAAVAKGEEGKSTPSAGDNGIQIVINSSANDGVTASLATAGQARSNNGLNAENASPRRGSVSSVGSEEDRRRKLDELERRIGNLSPRNQWEEDNGVDGQQGGILVESPEPASPSQTPTIAFEEEKQRDREESPSIPVEAPSSTLPVPSTKAARRQVSIGSFNSIPGAAELAQQLASVPSPPLGSPPLSPEAAQEAEDADDEHEPSLGVQNLAPIDLASPSPTPTTPGFPMSPDPFHREVFYGRAMRVEIPPPTTATMIEHDSEDGPKPRVSSRFSTDSTASDDGKFTTRAERTGSIMSVKSIRSLWRKSGGTKNSVQPLMSPGIGGQHTIPPTPPPFGEAPPLPMGGFLTTMAQPIPRPPPSPISEAETETPASVAGLGLARQISHGRSDSGLDPFHFDQDSRYPVHKLRSPSQALTDMLPPSTSIEPLGSPPLSSPAPNTQKKGILKGWGSKGTSSKRASGDDNHPPSSFGSGSKKSRQPSVTSTTGTGHSKTSSKTSVSSIGTNGKNSGTSHGSNHSYQIASTPSLPLPADPSAPNPSGRSSPASVNT